MKNDFQFELDVRQVHDDKNVLYLNIDDEIYPKEDLFLSKMLYDFKYE